MEKQRQFLEKSQNKLGVGPVEMARLLETNFNTYKAWLYEINPMPGAVKIAIECLIREKDNEQK